MFRIIPIKKFIQFIYRFLIELGKISGFFSPFYDNEIYFFFPYYHIGGAERVHLNIVNCVKYRKIFTFFTKKSKNDALKAYFEKYTIIKDLSSITQYRVLSMFYVGLLSVQINRNNNPIVFGCNNFFFYDLIPHLDQHVRLIDLIHAFGGGIENISINYVKQLDTRIVINLKTKEDLINQYQVHNIKPEYEYKIKIIENCVQIPDKFPNKPQNSHIRILYVGRGTSEKRVHLIGKIAMQCSINQMPAEFVLIGELMESIDKKYHKYCTFLGEITNESELKEAYVNSDILLITSTREGFPLAVMEAMAQGVIPICTRVGGITEHIRDGINGFLIDNANEEYIVSEIVKKIAYLYEESSYRKKLSLNSFYYANEHFDCKNFCRSYQELINSHLS